MMGIIWRSFAASNGVFHGVVRGDLMYIRIWGTRGSLPRPGPTTILYGGNTPCVEVRAADGTLIVLDCGTGSFPLAQTLVAPASARASGHLLITHTHWDHIQGFPFFSPLFVPRNEWDIYAPKGIGKHLEQTLASQMDHTYFPVNLDQMGATIRYHELLEGTLSFGSMRVVAQYLNHSVITLGYRLEEAGASFVYATDHEPHVSHDRVPAHARREGFAGLLAHPEDRRHVEFLAGADLVIHDTMYTADEYPQKARRSRSARERRLRSGARPASIVAQSGRGPLR
jgi:ribonuclease BN (tRNA processing enzyme)